MSYMSYEENSLAGPRNLDNMEAWLGCSHQNYMNCSGTQSSFRSYSSSCDTYVLPPELDSNGIITPSTLQFFGLPRLSSVGFGP
eukprot:scaffold25921_cov137-Cylindrotheca_fusiformis.AAC.6